MDQKLLLKEKDYELMQTKRLLVPRHSFTDPLINPPKIKDKKKKNNPILVSSKPSKLLSNDVLERKTTKVSKPLAPA
jgi:hypothetical protein